ncbi:unnamed protein product, partial [Owenia fusiformis]
MNLSFFAGLVVLTILALSVEVHGQKGKGKQGKRPKGEDEAPFRTRDPGATRLTQALNSTRRTRGPGGPTRDPNITRPTRDPNATRRTRGPEAFTSDATKRTRDPNQTKRTRDPNRT